MSILHKGMVALLVAATLALALAGASLSPARADWPPLKVDLAIQQDGNMFTAVVWVRNEGDFDTDVLSVRAQVPKGARYIDFWAGSGRGFNAGLFDGNDVGWVNPGVKAGARQGPFVYVFDAQAVPPESAPSVSAWVGWAGKVPGNAVSRSVELGTRLAVAALQSGGNVVLLRHGETDRSLIPREIRPPERQPMDLANCDVQAKLTEKGRRDARAIGAAFESLRIPVGQVLSSGYCRTLETARLAFRRAEASEILLHSAYLPVPGAPVPPSLVERTEALKQLLATPQAAGTNTVLVSHGETISPAVGFEPGTGEVSIFKADGRGGFSLVARVLPSQWAGSGPPMAFTVLDGGVGAPPAAGWKWQVMRRTTGPAEVAEDSSNHGNFWVFYVLKGSTEVGIGDSKKVLGVGEATLIAEREEHTHRFPAQSEILGFHVRPGDRPPGDSHRGQLLFTSEQTIDAAAANYSVRVREFTLAGGEQRTTSIGTGPFAYVVEGTLSIRLGTIMSTADSGEVLSLPTGGTIVVSNGGTTPLKFILVDLHS